MKTIKYFFVALLATVAISSSAQITKTVAPNLMFKHFQDTLVVGYPNPVQVTNVKNQTITMTADNGCSVSALEGVNYYNVSAPRAAVDKDIFIIVTRTGSTGQQEIIRRKVRVVSASPSLIARMQN